MPKTYVSGWRPEGYVHDEFLHGPKAGTFRACKTCGGMHALNRWPHNCMPDAPQRSELPSPQVVRDGLDDVLHPVTHRPYTSKRALRADYRRRGLIEVGDQAGANRPQSKAYEPDQKQIECDIKQSIETLSSDNISNDEMANMMRAPAAVEGGLTVI